MTHPSLLPILLSNRGQRAELDFYETPLRATNALLGILGQELPKVIWEPCVGAGAIAKPLLERGVSVIGGDIKDYGFHEVELVDVLAIKEKRADVVITNPPYRLAAKIIRHLLKLDVHEIWMPLRLNFLEGKTRHDLFADGRFAGVHVFVSRLDFNPTTPVDKSGGMMTFAWFHWSRVNTDKPTLSFIDDLRKT